jgi:hypothetical protein
LTPVVVAAGVNPHQPDENIGMFEEIHLSSQKKIP